MRFLIICEFVGKNAPGIVFEKLIMGLSNTHEITVVSTNASSLKSKSNKIELIDVPKLKIHARLVKLSIKYFKQNFIDYLWALKVNYSIRNIELDSFKFVFSFISNYHYGPLVAGNFLSKRLGFKHLVYSVDAIPAPIGWLNDKKLFIGKREFIQKNLSKVDGFFSANEKMLKYQLGFFEPKFGFFSGVIYNPTDESFLKKVKDKKDKIVRFVFTGGIYGPRKADLILNAFEKFLSENQNALFIFVGTKIDRKLFSSLKKQTQEKIKIYEFSSDLIPFFESATALIDIDGELKDDVFLSSKIINYLSIPRIIISQTGENSPSQLLFNNIPSILQCGHNSDELLSAMRLAEDKSNSIDFSDRNLVLNRFRIHSIVNYINNSLEENI
jgi:glycosyltransferase involved in cell wall biosynthesis